MRKSRQNANQIHTLTLGAILTTLVIILQLMGTFTAFFGPFSTAVALIPIAIGAVMCGPAVGAWLGFVFGVVVLASGGAALFMGFDIPGTIITVLAKGTFCGLASGLVYKMLKNKNEFIAAFVSAIVCPLVNTGIFLLGCAVFFLDNVIDIASKAGSPETGMAVFVGFAMANFIIEIGSSAVFSPIIVRLIRIGKKTIR